MIAIYLSARALAAARSIDPAISPAAVHAAVEVAVAEELMRIAGSSRDEIRARAHALLVDHGRSAA
jgi:hypothetical protein